jgi:prepilin-type N-terminal cleavage/methylation domain-containing protein/prepilin-type processing-associated H-X9-DG protein
MHCRSAFTLVELLVVIAVIAILAALIFPVFARVRESGRAISCLSNMRQIGVAVTLYVADYDDTFPMNRLPDENHDMGGCTAPQGVIDPSGGLEGSSLNWKRSLFPYIKNRAVLQCPSNGYAWTDGGFNGSPGDESNYAYPLADYLPNSYAYNGTFFHEAVPPCWYGEELMRPRRAAEISSTANLILLLESRLNLPDIGTWLLVTMNSNAPLGPIQTHNNAINFLFADQHAKRLKLRATCLDNMWSDIYPDKAEGCKRMVSLPSEYQ